MTNANIAAIRKFYLNGDHLFMLKLWQWLPLGTIVKMSWPGANDPNEVWRPWLTANVGRQTLSWEWWLDADLNTVNIRFLKRTRAAEFVLRYG